MAAAIAIPVVGWFVSPAFGKLLEHVTQLRKEKNKLGKDVDTELDRLELDLSLISGFLQDAEGKQRDDPGVHAWLWKLKQILYEAEDLLDLHATDIALKQRQEEEEVKIASTSSVASAVVSYFSESESSDLSVAKQVKDIRERLDDMYKLGDKLGLTKKAVASQQTDPLAKLYQKRETGSCITEKLVGREEKIQVVKKLLLSADVPSGDSKKLVIPIVGMGGLGKTTLAKHVFNDKDVVEYFKENRVWVCVGSSTRVDRRQLLAEIVRSLDKKITGIDSWSLNLLQNTLLEMISDRQPLLLVLDDAWNSDRETWKMVLEPFRSHTGVGNKVIVTTRNREVANCIRGKFKTIDLDLLEDEDMWIILKRNAFDEEEDSNRCSKLEPCGRQIVERLKGLPLAAETIGSLLRGKNREFWDSILEKLKRIDSNRLEIDSENYFLRILMLSHECLPAVLKPCFSYLSLFRKDEQFVIDNLSSYPFSKDDITRQWMAHKFVPSWKDADDGFEELFSRSLLQIGMYTRQHDRYGLSCFQMHDFIHDLAENISKGEIVRMDDDSIKQLPKHIRHVSFFPQKGNTGLPQKLEDHKTLRSLVLFSWDNIIIANSISILDSWFKNLRYLRVLVLFNNYMSSLPDSIGNLCLLRLLDLRLKRLTQLPETISDLYNLQVLKLQECKSLLSFPISITKLVNLRYMDVDDSKLLGAIHGIGNLTSLAQLKEFCVGRQDGFKIKELERLDKLSCPLRIDNLENVADREEAQAARLHQKKDIKKLELIWKSEQNAGMQSGVLEGLCPCNNLRKLAIDGYRGASLPSWLNLLSLPSLGCLELIRCNNVVNLPCLSSLHTLKIESCKSLANICFLPSSVPSSSLKFLTVNDCPCLDGSLCTLLQVPTTSLVSVYISSYRHPLVGVFSGQTALSFLTLKDCSECITLDLANLVSLRELYITDCPGALIGEVSQPQESLSNCQHNLMEHVHLTNSKLQKSLYSLYVDECPLMVRSLCQSGLALPSLKQFVIKSDSSLGDTMLSRCLSGLTALQELFIFSCPNIKSISSLEVLRKLADINQLWVHSCEGIKELNFQALVSLERLNIYGCPSLMFRQAEVASQASCSLLRPLQQIEIGGFNSEQLAGLSSLLEHAPPRMMELRYCTVSDATVGFGLQNLCRATALEQLHISFFKGPLITFPPLNFLKRLYLSSCSNITSLPVLNSLVELKISDCRGLVMLRNDPCPLLPLLESIKIVRCSVEQISTMLLEVTRSPLKKLQIDECNELECFEGELELPFLSLTSLEELTIRECSELRHLPTDLRGFEKLLELWIDDCAKMSTLPHDFPSSLTCLCISKCPSLKTKYVDEGAIQHLPLISYIDFT